MFFFILPSLLWCLRVHGVSGVNTERLSVHEGERITLHTGVKTDPQKKLMWYFTLVDDIPIAEITGDLSKSCTDVQCKGSDGRFRKRLKLDPQTGSLTITETRTSDSGVYKLKIDSSRLSAKIFNVAVHSFFSVDTDEESAFVIEGDSVTLHTGVTTNQQEKIKWYFNNTRIAQINRDLSVICTDVQCNDGTERFRDRLKLDNQTGSLTITNIISTDSGVYQLRITSSNSSTKSFIVAVYDYPVVEVGEIKKKSVKEGESVTLDTHVIKTPNDLMTWYVNDILIAEITGDPNKTCTDDQCDGRFRDRLKLDHQTGSLTITNTTNTDSGVYKLRINSSRISIMRIFSVTVSIKSSDVNVTGSGPSSAVTGICVFLVGCLLAAAVTALIYRRRRTSKQAGQYDATEQNNHESNGVGDSMPLSERDSTDLC
ncbi:uncharacterized protein [Pseudorasbora parva]|uniref:uncharacterized protein isoform X2 n=1 Tax=Pseudorasbora parva TaxID=51549 RepID=UPI00351EAD38